MASKKPGADGDPQKTPEPPGLELLWLMAINNSAVSPAALSFAFSLLICRRWEASERRSPGVSGTFFSGIENSCGSRFIGFFFGCDDAGERLPLGFARPTGFGGMVVEGEKLAGAQGFGKWRKIANFGAGGGNVDEGEFGRGALCV